MQRTSFLQPENKKPNGARPIIWPRWRWLSALALLAAAALLCAGCSLMQLKEETRALKESASLVGRVEASLPVEGVPIIVAAFSPGEGGERHLLHYTALHEPGPYELMVPEGACQVAAFADVNGNLRFDKGEAAGLYSRGELFEVPAGGVLSDVNLVISANPATSQGFPYDKAFPAKNGDKLHFRSPGAIADLDGPLFSASYGSKGLMAPVEFYLEVGGNVYFLEEFDPGKVPVLFIHGAGGSPQDWRAFFKGIDRDRFQPWFFYYPSGASLNSMSNLLFWKMINLRSRYNFEKIHIVAHSMGGLVARSFIVNFGAHFPAIDKFISISTPWGGEALAGLGVEYSPAVVPSWHDMTPDSPFIESIFAKELPPGVEYFLFFGHKGNRNIFRPNNDKAVTLASQLDMRAQADARMTYGFDEDHVSILSSEQVLSQASGILAAEKSPDEGQEGANRLKVSFSFEADPGEPLPQSILLLRSADSGKPETWIYLTPNDEGRLQGPFPPGDYSVSLMAPSFVSEPISIPVTFDGGSSAAVEFKMKRRNSLSGYVVGEGGSMNQAGEPRNYGAYILVDSITLSGQGIKRTVTPLEEKRTYTELYLSGTDFLAKEGFQFFDLPAGEYRLSVEAEGYSRYIATVSVGPGSREDITVMMQQKR